MAQWHDILLQSPKQLSSDEQDRHSNVSSIPEPVDYEQKLRPPSSPIPEPISYESKVRRPVSPIPEPVDYEKKVRVTTTDRNETRSPELVKAAVMGKTAEEKEESKWIFKHYLLRPIF